VLGLVFAYAPGQSTLVIPKEKKAIYMQSQFPLVVLQDSKISDDFLFSVLLYDFSDLFAQTKYIKTEKHLRWYEDAGKTRLALDAHTGQLKKVYLLDQDVQVTFGPLRQNMNFPSIIDIQEGDNKIRWVWKQIDDQTKIPDAWFEVDIPSNFVVEEQ
ncbi:MAG: hypothetical protein KDK51_06895, partial [Deltaproteobacteria bacterium]|nr:hypothetical protein [Deltaproteobacteria bacterium]